MESLQAFNVMVYRQVKRFLRARSRVVTMMVQPIMWIFFFGLGMGGVFSFNNPMLDAYMKQQFGGLDYVTFLTTGVIAMSIFMGSFISGVSVLWDKQFGFLKETLAAPAPRSLIILGRAIGDALIVLLQGAVIALIAKVVAPGLQIAGLPMALGYGFILAIGFISAGVALATKVTSPEGFHMIVNLLMMPLMFLSGVFFPVERMPEWAQWIAKVNPLTYAVDGMRYWLTGKSTYSPLLDVMLLTILSIALLITAIQAFERTTIED